jgi:hypothetical protein
MSIKKQGRSDKTKYDEYKQFILNNRWIAVIVLVVVCLGGIFAFYEKLTVFLDKMGQRYSKGEVRFSTPHEPLHQRGRVSIRRDSQMVHVVGFDTSVRVTYGCYNAAAHIDNRVLLEQPFEVQGKRLDVVFQTRFAVKGIVADGRGRPLPNVIVRIGGRQVKTKHNGFFILDDLPMQRVYEIEAYPDIGNPRFNASHPWTGTVYNGNWETTVTQNIALVL